MVAVGEGGVLLDQVVWLGMQGFSEYEGVHPGEIGHGAGIEALTDEKRSRVAVEDSQQQQVFLGIRDGAADADVALKAHHNSELVELVRLRNDDSEDERVKVKRPS